MNITPKYSPTSDGSGRTILFKAKARPVAGGDRQGFLGRVPGPIFTLEYRGKRLAIGTLVHTMSLSQDSVRAKLVLNKVR